MQKIQTGNGGEKRARSLGILTGASVLIYLVLQVDGEVRLQRLISDPVCESGTPQRREAPQSWYLTRRANSVRLFGWFTVYNLVNLRWVGTKGVPTSPPVHHVPLNE